MGVSRDGCDCLAEGRCYIAEPPGIVTIIVIAVHMPDGLCHMVAGVANRQMGCMASPRRVSSAGLRGARGSLTDKKIVNIERAWIAAVDGAKQTQCYDTKAPVSHPSSTRG